MQHAARKPGRQTMWRILSDFRRPARNGLFFIENIRQLTIKTAVFPPHPSGILFSLSKCIF
ncbi:hypothetical protein CNY67_09945 [Desulfovibrio sp. G11]|nr:hypothetical protein CNY67_09945 [Desulfovibrio sp. G11]